MEQWREIPGFPLYEVSDLGLVRSRLRTYTRPNPRNGQPNVVRTGGRILKGWVRKQRKRPATVFVALRRDGMTVVERVHRLVLLAFVGPCPEGMEGCHNDGNPLNNRLSNLRWDTHHANIRDMHEHGRFSPPPVHIGSRHPRAALTEEAVRQIRSFAPRRGLHAELARRYGVTQTTIWRVRKGEGWQHVGGSVPRSASR